MRFLRTLPCHGTRLAISFPIVISLSYVHYRSLKEIRAAIPSEFFVRDTRRGLLYLARDILCAGTAWTLASFIDPYFKSDAARETLTPVGAELARWASWGV